MSDMNTATRTPVHTNETLINLRKKATELAIQSENEELLAEVVAMLSGIKLPCTYTHEEFANVLHEAEADYEEKQCVSHEQLFAQYGL